MLNNCISQSLAITRYFRHYQHGLIAAPLLFRQTTDLPPAVPRTGKLETTFQMFDWFISPSFGTSFFFSAVFQELWFLPWSLVHWKKSDCIKFLKMVIFLSMKFNVSNQQHSSSVLILVTWPGLTNQRWLLWSCDLAWPIRGQVVELLTSTSLENNLKSVSNVA